MDDGSLSSSDSPSSADQGEDGCICVSTWNVNSIKARMPLLATYLKTKHPDFMMLQEIKTQSEAFPFFELESMGYRCLVCGQKSYNGVALLSKHKTELVTDKLPDAPDNGEQARYIEAFCPDTNTLLISVYVPNGEPPANDLGSTERLDYKTAWLDALTERVKKLLRQDTPFIIGGDFNVIEYDTDVYDPAVFKDSVFTIPAVRNRFRAFYYTGLTNALRRIKQDAPVYSYWDYRAGAWERNNGILLDHLFLSPFWADRLISAAVDTEIRECEKTSDHAPLRGELSLQ